MALPTSALGKIQNEALEQKIASLPTNKKGLVNNIAYKYEGFWFERPILDGVIRAQETFEPRPNDVMIATFPKSGTTWFSALLLTTMNRSRYSYSIHPLLRSSPVDFTRWIEFDNPETNWSCLLKTHIPFTLLPKSIIMRDCPVIYVCRNPLDVFVSTWEFVNTMRPSRISLQEAFDLFCRGELHNGPYWDHVLGYWQASIEKPNQVLFVRYEDMKSQPSAVMNKLASFVGCPFSPEEEVEGEIAKIVDFCSFENLANLEVNQDDAKRKEEKLNVSNKSFFRKGKVGDYVNFLTDEMIQRLKDITYIKLKGSGLQVFP